MNVDELNIVRDELNEFIGFFEGHFGRSDRLRWCKLYISGLLLDGERKSIKPMAERLPGGNEQALQQFVNQSSWNHVFLQQELAHYMAKRLELKKGVLVLDDTSLPKKGTFSVGVSRQYCGALGKIANCQSLVTWHYCELNKHHFPLIGELFLPETWTENKRRMKCSKIPETRFKFLKKWQLALKLLEGISLKDFPYEALCFDAGYGEVREFMRELDKKKLTFVGQIPDSHSFWPIDIPLIFTRKDTGKTRKYPQIADKKARPCSASNWLKKLIKQKAVWLKVKLNLNSKKHCEVLAVRVRETIAQAFHRPGPERWLIIEKIDNQYKYYVSNASKETPIEKIVLWAHERWKIEQGYQQLKEELGLDHFEGRSWTGLHHHLTLCFMAFDFLTLLRNRANGKKNQGKPSSGKEVIKQVISNRNMPSLSYSS